jgi:outer membrane protein OmpA-like peptidoglycan-associated protein
VRVEGHTDATGNPAYNKELSQRRAEAVTAWLEQHGVEKHRLHSVGMGQERPIDTNATEEGRRNNRRVEFHIVEGR